MRIVSHHFDLQYASLPQNELDLQWPSILLHLILLYIFYSASSTFAHQSALFWLSKKYFIIRMFKLRYFWRLLWTYCQYKCWLEAFQFTFQQFTCLLVSAYFIEKFSQNFFHERVLNSGFQNIVSALESLFFSWFFIWNNSSFRNRFFVYTFSIFLVCSDFKISELLFYIVLYCMRKRMN